VEVWEAIRDQRLDIVEALSGLTDEQWDLPSLCSEWRIRDVLGHITAGAQGAYGMATMVTGIATHGFNWSRWMAADGRRRGQPDPTLTLGALRDAASVRKTPPGAPKVSVLTDVLIHGQDMCRPLGITRLLPEGHLRPVADFVSTSFVFSPKRRLGGLRLRATDMDWTHGAGPEVTGPAEALVMAMAGRPAALEDLAGEGQPTLAQRFA
jgi:uncharacterized protein (TIGR03083 family)